MTSAQPQRHAYVSAVTLGGISIAGQIVLMREIMVLFYGNELSAGVCLFLWLLWTSAGAFIGAAFVKKDITGPRTLSTLLVAVAMLLPATVVFSRVAKTIFGIFWGEIIGITPMAAIAAVVLLPFCFFSGLIFPLLIRAAIPNDRNDRDAPARIYLFESIGSSLFGVITARRSFGLSG
jgi:spermidine synthase